MMTTALLLEAGTGIDMAWGLGEKTTDMAKGAMQMGSHVAGQAIEVATNPFRFLGKYSVGSFEQKRMELDRIANPQKYDPKFMKSGEQLEMFSSDIKDNSYIRQKYNLTKHFGKENLKSFGIGTAISGGLYGLSAYATDDPMNSGGDRMAHYGKHAVAAGVDIASDAVLTGASVALATFGGPAGMFVAGGLQMFNMFAGFAGIDAGSIAMNVMNYAEEEYDKAKRGPKFNMTQNTAMAMQRQIQNLHASGSNLGEIMHN